jgi:Flp pilus assembly pilin Flp
MRRRPDRGGVTTEYAMIAAWIGVAIAVAVALLGRTVLDFFEAGLDGFPP